MKLQQLRFLVATVDAGLNVTRAAQKLFTSQPGVSKQLRLLEDELGVQLFIRHGRSLKQLTDAGQNIVEKARRILTEVENIKRFSQELHVKSTGVLRIATTHTQARYVLPDVLQAFHKEYPDIEVVLQQGTSEQIAELTNKSEVDLALASGDGKRFEHLVQIPCFDWNRIVLTPKDHALMEGGEISVERLAEFPLLGYTFSFEDDSDITKLFKKNGLKVRPVFTTHDPDLIKTYVRKGMGVGIIAGMAYDPEIDTDLGATSVEHLLPNATTWLGFQADAFLSQYIMHFIRLLAPNWSEDCIRRTQAKANGTLDDPKLLDDCLKAIGQPRLLVRGYSGNC